MSFAAINDPAPPQLAQQPSKPTYKSYKKKFLKIRHKFKDRMRESSRLYDEEQHSLRLAKRLQEQNDQLLDLLLDVNHSVRIPPQLRFDLRSPTPTASDVPTLEPDISLYETHDITSAHAALREARSELDAGQMTLQEYRDTEASLTAIINAPSKSLASLSRTTHTPLSSVKPALMPDDLNEEFPTGYLGPVHEDEYLSNLDSWLAGVPLDTNQILPRTPKPTDKERDKNAQLDNPVSVYNWLRRHTKTFLQDNEKDVKVEVQERLIAAEAPLKPLPKPASAAGTGSAKASRKRASSAVRPKLEPAEEILDDEGYLIGGGDAIPEKKKRKREDDDPYRPKGGSGRARKKTKGGSGAAAKRAEGDDEAV